MSDITVARRYAQALYEEGVRQQRTEQVDADMALIRASLADSRELVRFFESPILSRKKKRTVVTALFEARIDPTTLRFLQLLIDKRREGLFSGVVQAYDALRDQHLGFVEAHARTATPLSDAEEKHLVQTLEQMTEQRIRLHVKLDPELIGGIIIRVGDTVYDGSVRNHLASLREKLEYGSFMTN